MNAGPDLDRLVAEKVMGWHRTPHTIVWWNADGTQVGKLADVLVVPTDNIEPWSPSTTIADAWDVVEKLYEQGIGINILKHTPDDRYTTDWVVWLRLPSFMTGTPRDDSVSAPTAPLAICLAALKAVGYAEA